MSLSVPRVGPKKSNPWQVVSVRHSSGGFFGWDSFNNRKEWVKAWKVSAGISKTWKYISFFAIVPLVITAWIGKMDHDNVRMLIQKL